MNLEGRGSGGSAVLWLRIQVCPPGLIVSGLVTLWGLHLSAAGLLRSSGSAAAVGFTSFDEKLNSAAAAETFKVLQPK